MTDGERIYAYYGGYELAGGLWYRSIHLEEEKFSLYDGHDGMTVQISSKNGAENSLSLIAARPLTAEGWQKFPAHEVRVFENGKLLE
jgi:hypothetical protein